MVRSSMRPAVVVMRHVTAQGVPWTPPEIQAVIVFGLGQTSSMVTTSVGSRASSTFAVTVALMIVSPPSQSVQSQV